MDNTHENMINDIFACHDKLEKLDKGTLEFGFEWKPENGLVLFPKSTLSQYLKGFFHLQYPQTSVIELSWETTAEDAEKIAQKYPYALVVLSTLQSYLDHDLGMDYAELAKRLPKAWLGRVITARQLGEFLPAGTRETKFLDYFRKTNFPTEAANKKKILKAWQLFEDSLSRETWLAILKRYLLRADTIVPVIQGIPYFENFFTLGDEEIIVDCGAFTGDTMELYLRKIRPIFAQYHAFEPDPNNFSELLKTISQLPTPLGKRVHPWPNAVGHTPKKLLFENRGALESHVSDKSGNIEVASLPLDMALQDVQPTFIKMDLEGFEAFALLGARNIIRTARPVLAICVYHYAFDFWELPLLVASFVKAYRFFIRAYNEIFDYVLYAVPEEKLNNK